MQKRLKITGLDDRHGLSPILYDTQRPSLFTLINYCAIIVFSFALIFTNGWFTARDGF